MLGRIAARWAAGALAACAVGCSSPYNHQLGEVCSNYAGQGSTDAGQGDCQPNLTCACDPSGCFCSFFCPTTDAGCPSGLVCTEARNIGNQSSNAFCMPPSDAG